MGGRSCVRSPRVAGFGPSVTLIMMGSTDEWSTPAVIPGKDRNYNRLRIGAVEEDRILVIRALD